LKKGMKNPMAGTFCATELPWNGGNRLVNLWIMQILFAKDFSDLKDLISAGIYLRVNGLKSEVIPHDDVELIVKDAQLLEVEFRLLDLKLSRAATARFLKLSPPSKSDVLDFVNDVESRFTDELASISFVHLASDRVEYYENSKPFGELVWERFPSVEYDICEASNCFAFERHTATVMHSMRVLEAGLSALAKLLKVKRGASGWGTDLREFDKAWKKLTDPKSNPKSKRLGWKRSFVPQLFLHFHYFGDAWRNRAFHQPKAQYGDTEARRVFEHVRDFMQLLATRLREKPIR
jgi:hypothetical protein